MSDVTRILTEIQNGDERAAAQLLPLVYRELHKLAASYLARERPGHTLQATALVHEAYVRLVGGRQSPSFRDQGHFFGAAAGAMRRILIENARRRHTAKRGGDRQREPLDELPAPQAD